jgi:hypothetical protein
VIADVVDTVCTLGVALLAWIALVVLAATLALHAVVAVVWWVGRATVRGVKAACAWLYGHESASNPRKAVREGPGPREASQAPSGASHHHGPSWARTDKDAA